MPADVFTAEADRACAVDEQCGMQGAAMARQALCAADALAQAVQVCGRRQRAGLQRCELRQRLLQGRHAAQAAAAGAGQLPALLFERPEGPVADVHLGVEGSAKAFQADVINFVDGVDQATAQAETGDEVLHRRGRNHHHRMADAVVGDRQRALLGQYGIGHGGRAIQLRIGIATG
ncbi:hypothetical protein D9M68_778710 [compost metagenome]